MTVRQPGKPSGWELELDSALNPLPRRAEALIYAGIWLFALLVRTIYLLQIRHTLMFSLLMEDARDYDAWAQELAKGHWLGNQVFFQAPLYPYFLGVLYTVFGHDLFLVRVAQVILGTTSCLFVALAGRLFFSRSAGILAGVLLALCPSAIYFSCLIQKSVLDLFFLSLLLLALGLVNQKPRAAWWTASGACLGLLTLSRENALILVVAILAWLVVHFRPEKLATRLRWAASLFAGLAIVLFPVALRNEIVGGEFHLTTWQLGQTLYGANNKNATGIYRPLRPGRGANEMEKQDAVKLAESALGRKLTRAEVSRYWVGQVLAYIRSDPVGWLRLMARKWFLTWNAIEIPDTEDLYTYSDASPLLRALNSVFHFGVLCPLGVLGMVLTWRMRERIWLLYATLGIFAAGASVFVVFGRYRFPIVAWLVMFAAAGLVEGYGCLRAKRHLTSIAAAGVAALAAVFANWPSIPENACRAVAQVNMAIELIAHQGRIEEAVPLYRRALELQPESAQAHSGLAGALAAEGNLNEAGSHYAEAARLEPDLPNPPNDWGSVLASRGQLEDAIPLFRLAIRLQPDYALAHCNLATALAYQGKLDEAIAHFVEAARIEPDFARALYGLGNAMNRQGRSAEAVAQYKEVLRLNPDHVAALNDLAKILSTHVDAGLRNPVEALSLATRACELTGNRDPFKLDTLAMAYAAAGQFQSADQTAQKAATIAAAMGNQELARAVQSRLELYKLGKPYHESPMDAAAP